MRPTRTINYRGSLALLGATEKCAIVFLLEECPEWYRSAFEKRRAQALGGSSPLSSAKTDFVFGKNIGAAEPRKVGRKNTALLRNKLAGDGRDKARGFVSCFVSKSI